MGGFWRFYCLAGLVLPVVRVIWQREWVGEGGVLDGAVARLQVRIAGAPASALNGFIRPIPQLWGLGRRLGCDQQSHR